MASDVDKLAYTFYIMRRRRPRRRPSHTVDAFLSLSLFSSLLLLSSSSSPLEEKLVEESVVGSTNGKGENGREGVADGPHPRIGVPNYLKLVCLLGSN